MADTTEEEDSAGQASSSVWVPWSAADQDRANKLALAHPNPTFGELIRQNTLAAAVLTHYLDDHGIEMDHAAANHTQAVLQLLNPTADVVLPKLGKLEALLVPQDSGAEPLDLSQVRVEIDLNPATLAYILVELGEGGAWLTGVLLSSDLGQDFPEGGAVSLAMMKPMSALWEAYCWWQKCQQITTQFSDEQGWSVQQRTETITFLNWLLTNSSEYERPTLLKDFLEEKASENHENFKPLVSRPEGVREATPEPSSEGAVDWLDVAMDLLDELGKFI
ncbi:MAG: DUF1822 family protein [Microcystis aeruginosa Ma_AC_P_19900807_S299]|uniref:DUF1822 family protein n=1 Tax=Microcystis aeruginosa Ma_SC_T_19800800_S464 TaxID=2486257 RepID=A0A552DTT4_MICAE|nr:MAG: DUF1822 family protein [Microcystis aeruginosa Ma_AC_P_19900807_S299]TRU25627.1 MAG: DUF1822 family protein [Microcystis aeruginosa Ma_SC_T_19800800_S464]